MNKDTTLQSFRDLTSQVFRLAMTAASGDHHLTADLFDKFMDSTVSILEMKEKEKAQFADTLDHSITSALLSKVITPPTLIVHEEPPCVVNVVKKEDEAKNIVIIDNPADTESIIPDDESEKAEEQEPKEEAEDEDEDEKAEDEKAEDEEAEEAEDEDMEVIRIGKKKYFHGEKSKQVFVFLSDEEAGECLGKLENGKIVPL